jgi:hypothetical protein
MQPSFLPRPVSPGDDADPFLMRVLLMPFQPRMWSAAARWRLPQVILPLIVLILLVGGALAAYRSWEIRPALQELAQAYDKAHPAIIVENGEVRVEGDGVIRHVQDDTTILVDPEETVPIDRITTPEYIVIRKREIIRGRPFGKETIKIADLEPIIGQGPLRIDGDGIRSFAEKWGFTLRAGVFLFLVLFILLGETVGCAVYSLAAGGIVLIARGRGLSLDYAACFRVALCVSSLTVVLQTALNLMGSGPGACVGFLVWPSIITGLSLWAVGRA